MVFKDEKLKREFGLYAINHDMGKSPRYERVAAEVIDLHEKNQLLSKMDGGFLTGDERRHMIHLENENATLLFMNHSLRQRVDKLYGLSLGRRITISLKILFGNPY